MPLPRLTDADALPDLRAAHSLFDLHYHTTWSDGIATPRQALDRARDLGIRLAITDHNMIEGALEAWRIAGDEAPDRLIPGIEITTLERIHILVYFRRPEALQAFFLKSIAPHRVRGGTATTPIPRPVAWFMEELQAYECLTAAAHPFAMAKNGWMTVRSRYDYILDQIGELDAVEVLNGQELDGPNDQAAAFARARSGGLVAGSDGHTLAELGRVVMALPTGDDLFGMLKDGVGTLVDLRPPGTWRRVLTQAAKAPYYLKKPGRFVWRVSTGDPGDGPETAGFSIDSW
jgi:predicted metal-dependent phosphoesterase TrpH